MSFESKLIRKNPEETEAAAKAKEDNGVSSAPDSLKQSVN